jgi:hypothetical protein
MSRNWPAATEHLNHLPFPAPLFGVLAFVLLCALLVGTLMFGKGRPHS